jgi:hypothetical protein
MSTPRVSAPLQRAAARSISRQLRWRCAGLARSTRGNQTLRPCLARRPTASRCRGRPARRPPYRQARRRRTPSLDCAGSPSARATQLSLRRRASRAQCAGRKARAASVLRISGEAIQPHTAAEAIALWPSQRRREASAAALKQRAPTTWNRPPYSFTCPTARAGDGFIKTLAVAQRLAHAPTRASVERVPPLPLRGER